MNTFLVVMLVLSLSLVGSFSNSYADVGDFITIFNGTDNGGTLFEEPRGLAVDNDNRIIVSDSSLNIVQIFDSAGNFLASIEDIDGTAFNPFAVAVDSEGRILVTDSVLNTVQIFESNGTFVTTLDGSEGDGTTFVEPFAVAVDTSDRIIVGDRFLNIVQIFESNGTFVTSFNGTGTNGDGTPFMLLVAIAVDNDNRIIVSDVVIDRIQIYDSAGNFITSISGRDGDGAAPINMVFGVAVDNDDNIIVGDFDQDVVQIFDSAGNFLASIDGIDGTAFNPLAIAVDSEGRILVTDSVLNTVQIFDGFIAEETIAADPTEEGAGGQGAVSLNKDGNGGCADCVSPTLGLNTFYKRIVDDGFSYNGNSVQVERWHTPFPLINATVGETNIVEIIVYENGGIHNMKLVQFGLGAVQIGQPLSELEVLIEVWLDTFSTNDKIGIEKVIIKDRDNLIETYTVFAVADVVKCADNSQDKDCIKVILEYSYREATINNILVVNARDKPGNAQNFFFNEGVQVLGDSLNEPPTYIIQNRKTSQQTEDLTLILTRTDKINHIWEDKYGIEYLQISKDRFDRLTAKAPIECTDPPLSEINVPTRKNCNFRAQMTLWN